jgi:predicted ArsR family transcriptional regulator
MEFLHGRRAATANELSRALRMTSANARHHLSILLDEGAVEVVGKRPSAGRGRPSQLYAITQPASNCELNNLVIAMVDSLITNLPPDENQRALRKIAQHLSTPGERYRNLTQRMNAAVGHLNQRNYNARWEAHSDGPRIILENCPYKQIIDTHQVPCQIDAFLLEDLLGVRSRQIAMLEPTLQGLPQCIFAVSG